ncbi:MAG: DMT family transporter [Candidatus Undinarchaeales archaeon]|jgi:drug/metabolite transporter (DMT)-like permease|nr:DMT family transporter [Candidatus Undinarchaeales archaeon]
MIPLWFLLSLGSAICIGIMDIIAKHVLKEDDPYIVVLGRMLFAAPLLLPILLISGIPKFGPGFWSSLIILTPLEILAAILFMKGLSKSPIALTVPFLAFTPAFMILTGFVILGETLTLYGISGILLIVLGTYILNIKNWRKGILAPFKAIKDEIGSVYLLGVAVIFSITSVLGKKAVVASSPLFFAGFYIPLLALLMFPIAIKKSSNIKKLFKKPGLLVIMGVLLALTAVLHFTAISMVDAAYMISVKRTSILLSTVLAYFIFKEDHITEHLIGAGLMLAGVVIITLLG